jgi:transposase
VEEASGHAETLFTGFAGPSGGVGGGRSLAPRHRENIQRECRHSGEVVAAFPGDRERGRLGDGRASAALSGQQAGMAAGADRGKAGPDIAGDQGRAGGCGRSRELWRALGVFRTRRHYVQKKSLHASEQDRADIARRREQWKKYQDRLDAKRLVFIDETWAKTNMTRRHGRCARGTRLIAKVPQARWRTLTFLAALRCDRITAPCVIDGPINGTSFRAYVEQFLAPTLNRGDVVIMDNLGSHKSQAVRRLIRATGAKLFFLPRYSPDLNPIEQVFSKLKTLLRKADPRTTEDTWRRIGSLLDHFTAKECANYLANAGYAST